MSKKAKELKFPAGTLCFVCGASVEVGGTWEHVIPAWLQRRLNLWDARYDIHRLRSRRYDQLRVPCCLACNHRMKAGFEDPILAAFEDPSAELEADTVRLWCMKINYGFSANDLNLRLNLRDPQDDTALTDPAIVESAKLDRLLLERVGRQAFAFVPAEWSSLFVYKAQCSPERRKDNFDYIDDPYGGFVAIRFGRFAVLCFLHDCGLVKRAAQHLRSAADAEPLNPTQFRELAAYGKAIAISLHGTGVTYDILERSSTGTSLVVLQPHYTDDAVRGPVIDVYHELLSFAWSRPKSEIVRDGLTLSSLHKPDGTPLVMDFYTDVRIPNVSLSLQNITWEPNSEG